MADAKKNSGLLKKFFRILSGKPENASEEEETKSPYTPSQKDPVDLSFVRNFTASGGKFLYCEKEEDAYQFLKKIKSESGIDKLFCDEENLCSILEKASFTKLTHQLSGADAFACSCEYLISYNGGIMISAKQTRGKKLSELPHTFITFARTSQIVENLRAGLTGIRERYKGDIPSQITTIRGPEVAEGDETSGQICKKEIYLLLVEDQL